MANIAIKDLVKVKELGKKALQKLFGGRWTSYNGGFGNIPGGYLRYHNQRTVDVIGIGGRPVLADTRNSFSQMWRGNQMMVNRSQQNIFTWL